ncbi:MAG: hypothetical protein LH609_16780 [Rudanella sp.]|nr:hypothetical protein [Rudanella sp.]
MSLLIRLLLSLLPYCFYGCLSRVVSPEPPNPYSADYWGTISALRNGKALQNPRIWAATRTPCNEHAFDIFIAEFNDRGEELVTFTLANIPQKACTLNQFRADYKNLFCKTDTLGSALTAKVQAGFEGTYKPSPRGNQLVIATFDSVRREITGTFTLRLGIDQKQSASAPDSIKIQQGTFHTKLKGPGGKYE